MMLFYTVVSAQSCDINGKKHYNYQDIKLILDKNNCKSCHVGDNISNNWKYDTYENMFSKSVCNENIITHGNPNSSILIDKVNGGPTLCGNAMPLGAGKISNNDLVALESWIELGAPEYCISEFDQIKNILSVNNCTACHSNSESWSFGTYTSMFVKPSESVCNGQEIVRFNAKESLLYKKITNDVNCGLRMPVDGPSMSAIEIAHIRDWINAGAPESAKALPVTLIDFRTELINEDKIYIFWQTESEVNTSHFEIEFSKDGVNFKNVGFVDSKGSGSAGHSYDYIFEELGIGFHYFRLKIIDFDGKYAYSAIRVVRIENENEIFRVLPNPVFKNSQCTIEWYSLDDRDKVKLLLVSITGQLRTEFLINRGYNSLDLSGIMSGVYYLSIEDYDTTRNVRKLIIMDY